MIPTSVIYERFKSSPLVDVAALNINKMGILF
jgi:hypothetical protein